jgi:uncharacterized protein (TIGR02452 family)
MSISRSKAAQLGKETVAILDSGRYSVGSVTVRFADELRHAVENTVSYAPGARLPSSCPVGHSTRYEVNNETTLAAARRHTGQGHRVVALNFASARHPGGGFLGGARAQEESLCRASGLYACIVNSPMYAHHSRERGGFYSNYSVYSPNVPVIRDDEGELLNPPYLCSFITAPAINVGALQSGEKRSVRAEMGRRIEKVLTLAAGHGHDAVVLGAWGCGVFKNDPEMIAELFRESLGGAFHGAFAVVTFAVLDWSDDRHFIGPFERWFRS